jgi:Putative Ig domain
MAVNKLNPSEGGIPYGNTAGRPANPGVGKLYSNGELQRLELYTGSSYGWQNIVAETPGVTSYTGTISETSGGTITIVGTNFASGAVATLIGTDGTEYIATTTTVNNLTNITAVFGAISGSKEPYDIRVTNPSNLYGVYYDILTVNDVPIWTTAAGSLGTVYAGIPASFTLSSTDEENNTLTYTLTSGSLPTGFSLNSSTGVISGTATGLNSSATTYSFIITVSDGINTAVSRSFSIIYAAVPTITGGTLTSDSTYYYRTFTGNSSLIVSNANINLDILSIGGGGGGGRPYAGGGGSGGATLYTSKLVNSGTSLITVGGGGPGANVDGAFGGGSNSNGTFSQFASLISGSGGGGGGNYGTGSETGSTPGDGGSGGGGGGELNPQKRGLTNQASSGSGYVSYGNNGGYGSTGAIYRGGGGGGLGGVGIDGGSSGSGGTGGSGSNTFSSWLTAISSAMTGVSGWSTATSGGYIGGGGGGGIYNSPGLPAGVGGIGGGGAGGRPLTANDGNNGFAGTTNTGSGGGGAGGVGSSATGGGAGGNGGSGIVVVRYTKASVGG